MIRQKNIFINQIENWTQAMKTATDAEIADGFALEKQGVYMQSTKSKLQTLTATAETFWQSFLDSSVLNGVIVLVTKLINALTMLTDAFGSVISVMLVFGIVMTLNLVSKMTGWIALLVQSTAAVNAYKGSMMVASLMGKELLVVIQRFGTMLLTFFMNPIGIAVAIIGALIAGFVLWKNHAKKVKEQLELTTKSQNDFNKALKEFNATLDKSKLKEMADGLEGLKKALNYDESIKKIDKLNRAIIELEETQSKSQSGLQTYWPLKDKRAELKLLEDSIKPVTEKINELNESTIVQRLSDEELFNSQFKKIVNNVREVASTKQLIAIYKDKLKQGKDDKQTRDQLLEKYPAYLTRLSEHGNMIGVNTDALEKYLSIQEKTAQAEYETTKIQMQADQALAKEKRAKMQLQLDEFKLTNAILLATNSIEQQRMKYQAKGLDPDSKNVMGIPQKKLNNPFLQTRAKLNLNPNWEKDQKEKEANIVGMENAIDQMDKMAIQRQNAIDQLFADMMKKYGTGDTYIPDGGDPDSTSEINEENFKVEADRYMNLTQALDKVNEALENNQALQKKANDTERIELLKQEVELLIQKRKAVNDIQYEQGQELIDHKKILSGTGDISQMGADYQATYQKYLSAHPVRFDIKGNIDQASFNELTKAIMDDTEAIPKKGHQNIIKINNELLKNIKKANDDYIASTQSVAKSANERESLTGDIFSKRNETQEKILDILLKNQKNSTDDLVDSLDKLKSAYDSLEDNQFVDKIKNIDKQIEIDKKLIEEDTKQIEELGKAWWDAQRIGDQAGMDKAHTSAETLRKDKDTRTKNIVNNTKTQTDEKVKDIFAPVENQKKAYEQQRKDLSNQLEMLNENDVQARIAKLNEISALDAQFAKDTVNNLTEVNKITDTNIIYNQKFQASYNDLKDSAYSSSKSLIDSQKAVNDEKMKTATEVQDTLVNLIKQGRDEEKKILDHQLQDFVDYQDNKLRAMDEATNQEEYGRQLQDALRERQSIQDEYDQVANAKDFESYARKKDLLKQLQDADSKLLGLRNKEKERIVKQGLDDDKTAEQKRVAQKKDSIDEQLSDEKIASTVRNALLAGSTDEFLKAMKPVTDNLTNFIGTLVKGGQGITSVQGLYQSFDTYLNGSLDKIGKQIQEQFINKMAVVQQILKSDPEFFSKLATIGTGSSASTIPNTPAAIQAGTGTTGTGTVAGAISDVGATAESKATNDYVETAKDKQRIGHYQRDYNKWSIHAMNGNLSPANLQNAQDKMKYDHDQAEAIRLKRGWTHEDFSMMNEDLIKGEFALGIKKGAVPSTGTYKLHKGELVMQPSQMMTFIQNMSKVAMPSVNTGNVAVGGGYGDINLNLNVYGNPDNSVVGQIKDASKQLLSDIKSHLNRNGAFRK